MRIQQRITLYERADFLPCRYKSEDTCSEPGRKQVDIRRFFFVACCMMVRQKKREKCVLVFVGMIFYEAILSTLHFFFSLQKTTDSICEPNERFRAMKRNIFSVQNNL